MKRLLALLLIFALLLPACSFAELDEEDFDLEEEVEDMDLDEDDGISDEVINAEPVSEELQEEIRSALENADFVPTSELDENNLFINRNLPDNVINILLLGVDTRNAELIEEDVKLADVQIILSLNTETGDVKLSSILRDTVVMNPFTGVRSPINYSLRSFDDKGKFHDKESAELLPVSEDSFRTGLITLNGKTAGTSPITVRKEPSAKAKSIGEWKPGTPVAVISEKGDFYFVEGKGLRGWVNQKFLKLEGEKNDGQKVDEGE